MQTPLPPQVPPLPELPAAPSDSALQTLQRERREPVLRRLRDGLQEMPPLLQKGPHRLDVRASGPVLLVRGSALRDAQGALSRAPRGWDVSAVPGGGQGSLGRRVDPASLRGGREAGGDDGWCGCGVHDDRVEAQAQEASLEISHGADG